MIGTPPRTIMYHYVRDAGRRPLVGYPALEPAAFERQLDELCRRHSPVGWPELRAAMEARRSLPNDALLLTFDDGLADHCEVVLPILVERRLPALFFVLARDASDGLTVGHKLHVLLAHFCREQLLAEIEQRLPPSAGSRLRQAMAAYVEMTADANAWKQPIQREFAPEVEPVLAGLIDRLLGPQADVARELYLTGNQMAELVSEGMSVGGHGRDHLWLDYAKPAACRAEVAASRDLLAAISPPPWPFAYPYGGVPSRRASLFAGTGFSAAFTASAGRQAGRFRLGREDGDSLARQT